MPEFVINVNNEIDVLKIFGSYIMLFIRINSGTREGLIFLSSEQKTYLDEYVNFEVRTTVTMKSASRM
jgi:hypothetical protein